MFSPLLESIIEKEEMPVVNETSFSEFCKQHDLVVLMVAGDYKRIGAVNDVAVILPELVKAYQGRFAPCVASRDCEGFFQNEFGFVLLPTLVFMHNGQKIGTISGVLDWVDYLSQINEILAGPTHSDAAE